MKQQDNPTSDLSARRYATISDWKLVSGMGRSATYQHLAAGNLVARKIGKRVLIDVQRGLAWMESQPKAVIGRSSRS